VVYILNNLLFFIIILTLVNVVNYRSVLYLSELKGIAFFYPMEAVGLSVALFSFIGVPPVLGFCSKYFILLITTKIGFFFSLIVSILSNALSAFYYLRILKFIWLERVERLRNYSYFFINCAQNNNRIIFLWFIISFIFCFWFLFIEYILDFCYFIILRLRLPATNEAYVEMFDLSTLVNYTFTENKDIFDDSLWIWFNMGSAFSTNSEDIIGFKPLPEDYLCSLARGTFFHKTNIDDSM
jgi:formate hydrogenlyase subunit 3/multisubunit Na+/H+ antiporter MnhD subunit